MRSFLLSALLLTVTCLPAWSETPAGAWQEGVHYRVLRPQQLAANQHRPGRVKVVEFFGYPCGYCYKFDPLLEGWRQRNAERIEFSRVHVAWGGEWSAYAQLHSRLKLLGHDEDLHREVFETVHQANHPLIAKTPEESLQLQLQFAAAHHIDAEQFKRAYASDAVDADLKRAAATLAWYKVERVPGILVADIYFTDSQLAGSPEGLLALTDYLLAKATTALRSGRPARAPGP